MVLLFPSLPFSVTVCRLHISSQSVTLSLSSAGLKGLYQVQELALLWRRWAELREEVSVWVDERTLKIEYQTTALSLYSIVFQPDHKHILDVKNPRRIETHFRSPQLDLWPLTDAEWLLALRRPEQGKRKKRHTLLVAVQLTFPDFALSG
jgi:hypothetical protein